MQIPTFDDLVSRSGLEDHLELPTDAGPMYMQADGTAHATLACSKRSDSPQATRALTIDDNLCTCCRRSEHAHVLFGLIAGRRVLDRLQAVVRSLHRSGTTARTLVNARAAYSNTGEGIGQARLAMRTPLGTLDTGLVQLVGEVEQIRDRTLEFYLEQNQEYWTGPAGGHVHVMQVPSPLPSSDLTTLFDLFEEQNTGRGHWFIAIAPERVPEIPGADVSETTVPVEFADIAVDMAARHSDLGVEAAAVAVRIAAV